MPFRPDLIDEMLEPHDAPRLPTDQHAQEVAQAGTDFLARIAHLTGKGVIPGIPAMPQFTVKRPTMEERARRRAERRARTEEPPAGGQEVQDF
ncbi:MAG TPA: hypothetical protein PKV72_01095 [Candidatus Peribacteria bacterium]|nr:hypothetical protein [Candidatus Peribacteria bacterium]